jgi:hypothetical protein
MELEPRDLLDLNERLKLVGLILGRLALLEVVTDSSTGAGPKATAGKALTTLGEDPRALLERMKGSTFSENTPDELRQLIKDLKEGRADITDLLEE